MSASPLLPGLYPASMNNRTRTALGGIRPETSRAPARPGTAIVFATIGNSAFSTTSALQNSEKSTPLNTIDLMRAP